MELSKNYIPGSTEEKWNAHWQQQRYFNSQPDGRPPFTVVIPPPNVTGVLHMGHVLNGTVQDILVRKARMSGYNACWVPGSDHASIATEARVVKMLKDQGIDKNQLTRPEFMKYAYEWKDKYGGIIYSQIHKLGCSVDWDRVAFTMDPHYYASVIGIFTDLFKQGLIYRGARMINWDPQAKTALSDEEVEYKEDQGILYYVQYKVVNADGSPCTTTPSLTIATQRPETIMGDTAICVNPSDERYQGLAGKFAIVPLVHRRVPIIFDEYVDPAFGTGALKVTPAHDINDYNLGLKHGLPIIDTLNADGTLSAAAEVFVGMERFAARKAVVNQLRQEGLLVKEETHMTRIGFSQRTSAVVEPRISTQWFVKMKELAGPALKAVTDGHIRIHPGDKFLATYKYWLENVKDWCISRQLWWGQQIPAWYDADGNCIVAANEEEAKLQAASLKLQASGLPETNLKHVADSLTLTRDEDVLDTWFSSWLWPIEVFKGVSNPGNPDINYYYPTSVLVTGQDIIFFWVARMIMAGLYFYKDEIPIEKRIPFRDVYFTGMVRDKQGRKMSKSLGNSPEVLELMDKYGADALRFGIMISSPAGNDLLYDEAALEQGRNFNNKLWNALKLVKGWEGRLQNEAAASSDTAFAVAWFGHRLRQARTEIETMFAEFRLSEALKTIYSLIWDDFCSWYLEWVKPGFEQPIDADVYHHTIAYFEQLVQLLHPFMPFITEELYHLLAQHSDDLCIRQFAAVEQADATILAQGHLLKEAITAIRDARNKAQIKPKEPISLYIQSGQEKVYQSIASILSRQVNAKELSLTNDTVPGTLTAVSGKDTFYIRTEQVIDTGAQKDELKKELVYLKGFLESVNKKLGNERFVQNAKPEVVAVEKKKLEDALAKIRTIEESLSHIG